MHHPHEVVDPLAPVDTLAAEVTRMTGKKSTKKAPKPPKQAPRKAPHVVDAPAYAPEAAFDDTIARTRGLAVPAASGVPSVPAGYQPTDPKQRIKRLRRIAGTLRSEVIAALTTLGARGAGVKEDLGKFAPDCSSAGALAARLGKTAALSAAADALAAFASEADQIALSDAVVLLEAVNKQLKNASASDPSLKTTYATVVEIFATRGAAVQAGKKRAKKKPAPPAA